MMELN